MIHVAVYFCYIAVCLSLLMNIWRLYIGPNVVDRVMAADTLVINSIVLLILYGIQTKTTIYFESALLLAMFSFISTVAYCRFLMRGDIIE
ncbi:MAG: K+/H+ antiporter subunit F [Planctomycetaceae bacterium]|jgi:multicomponent K+:H+ antiporter subunit F|nr:K+/H+ antiporter subunit F [Planctomycetaceae bacterium]